MALSISDQSNSLSYRLLLETDSQSSTPVINATGTSGSLYSIHADNAANGSSMWLKIYDGTDLTVGTTAPSLTFELPASGEISLTFPGGWAFNYLSFWVGTAADETNSADPSSAVKLVLVTS